MPKTIPNLDLGSSAGGSEEEEEDVGGGTFDRNLREAGCEGIFNISE